NDGTRIEGARHSPVSRVMTKHLYGTALFLSVLTCLPESGSAQVVSSGSSTYLGGRESDVMSGGFTRPDFYRTIQYLGRKDAEGKQEGREIEERNRRLREYNVYSPGKIFERFYNQPLTPSYSGR